MFRTIKIQKNILIIIGLLSLSYIIIFLLSPRDIADYSISDTEYWRETGNRLLLKTAFDYNNVTEIQKFPMQLGDWKGFDYQYPEFVYKTLNADILMSRAYVKNSSDISEPPIWVDFMNSKSAESFHKQQICVTGAGWKIMNESITEFKIAEPPNPYTKLYANRMDLVKVSENEKQLMIYWFLFKKFGEKDVVTMVRITSPIYNNDTEKTFNNLKIFLEGQLFGTMYKKGQIESITTAEYILNEYGNKGMVMITLILLIPIGMVFIGIRKK